MLLVNKKDSSRSFKFVVFVQYVISTGFAVSYKWCCTRLLFFFSFQLILLFLCFCIYSGCLTI